jgi:hypothetical protein
MSRPSIERERKTERERERERAVVADTVTFIDAP